MPLSLLKGGVGWMRKFPNVLGASPRNGRKWYTDNLCVKTLIYIDLGHTFIMFFVHERRKHKIKQTALKTHFQISSLGNYACFPYKYRGAFPKEVKISLKGSCGHYLCNVMFTHLCTANY